jgi:threonine synthase
MRYVSTRGGMAPASFGDVLLMGLAPDGGLVIPDELPSVTSDDLRAWRTQPYVSVAYEVMRRFVDVPDHDLARLVDNAYGHGRFDHPDVVSMREMDHGLWLAGLSHGPTLAFKDMALQLLGELFEYELDRRGTSLTVLGATSGDTGSSAEHAMVGKDNVTVFMLSPLGRTSPFQAAQMYTLDEPNIFNLAVRGVFDQCQDIVKAVNADHDFKARHRIGAVNSINWGRIAAQVAYYVYAAVRAGAPAREVSFAVPTGNFGNVLAGFVARSMGVPLRRLVVATNENDVLDEFFRTGIYRVRSAHDVVATSSPSMDISKASNFERFIHHLVGGDSTTVRSLFGDLDTTGGFDLSGTEAFSALEDTGIASGSSTHADRLATIRRFANEFDVVVDPHTADGLFVGMAHREHDVPMICLETAQPVKFASTIVEAIGEEPEVPEGQADLLSLPQRYDEIEPDDEAVKTYIERKLASRGTETPGHP